MSRKFKSILDELDYIPKKHKAHIIESRAHQLIASFGHLMQLIEENYGSDDASDLQKRLFNSLRTLDEEKFSRKLRSIDKGEI